MKKHLSEEQQAQFATFFNSVLSLLGPEFEGKIDTFMIAPLRYSMTAIYPVDETQCDPRTARPRPCS